MKKILCFFMVALLAALLVVPCFAAETTVDRGDPVDWFGRSTTYYSYSLGAWTDFPSSSDAQVVVAPVSISGVEVGDSIYCSVVDGSYRVFVNGVNKGAVSAFTGTYYFGNSSYTAGNGSRSGTPISVGSEGFVDAGFSDALSELSTIVSAILSNQYILIAIGLAVAVPLVAWGISKIKSLVKGY